MEYKYKHLLLKGFGISLNNFQQKYLDASQSHNTVLHKYV